MRKVFGMFFRAAAESAGTAVGLATAVIATLIAVDYIDTRLMEREARKRLEADNAR